MIFILTINHAPVARYVWLICMHVLHVCIASIIVIKCIASYRNDFDLFGMKISITS